MFSKGKTIKDLKSKRRNLLLKDNNNLEYRLFIRKNAVNKDDFSCGLALIKEDSNLLILIRCNGKHHKHKNTIEKTSFTNRFHIHTATERYIRKGLKADFFAEPTKEYNSIKTAYSFLIKKCNIVDVFKNKNPDLFNLNIWN